MDENCANSGARGKMSGLSRTTAWRRKQRSSKKIQSISSAEDNSAQTEGEVMQEEWYGDVTNSTQTECDVMQEEWYGLQEPESEWHECHDVPTAAASVASFEDSHMCSEYEASVEDGIQNSSAYCDLQQLQERMGMDSLNQTTPKAARIETECFESESTDWFEVAVDDANEAMEDDDCGDWYKETAASSTQFDDQPLYTGASVTLFGSLLLIVNFSFAHNITGECLSDLLVLISRHCMSPNLCLTSLYRFQKNFRHLKNPLKLHRFCSVCLYPVGEDERCNVCNPGLKCQLSYFIEIPMAKQLTDLFSRAGFYEDLQHRFNRKNRNESNIEDIYDGQVYKKHFLPGGFLRNQNNISLMWYTDGIPLFKSSKFNIWPICFAINELPYAKRTKTENLILGGLWFGYSKPSMLTFWKPFSNSIQELCDSGVQVTTPTRTDPFIVHAMLLCGTCDLPAKCMVLNMTQFNGEFGCPKCLQPGKSTATGKGSTWVFPFQADKIDGPERNHADTLLNGNNAMKNNSKENGIKGPTWLANVQPDIIRGTAIDYMHAVLLGVVRKLLKLWFKSKYSKELFSLSNQVQAVDNLLLKIKPPNFISRVPRSISEHMAYWKASECRSWLFYYSLPVLVGIMTTDYFEHYMLLVESVYTLNLQSISEAQVIHCKNLLIQFVCMYSALYGERHMSANVHHLLHLPNVVQDLGPLWVSSCFPFEDFNGRLLKLFHGTQHPEHQIINAVAMVMKLPELNSAFMQDVTIGPFLRHLTKYRTPLNDVIKLSGLFKSFNLTVEQLLAYEAAIGRLPRLYFLFTRMNTYDLCIPSASCKAVEKRNSYTVEYEVKGALAIGQVNFFIEDYNCSCSFHSSNRINKYDNCASECFALISDMEVKSEKVISNTSYESTCSHLKEMCLSGKLIVIPVTYIKTILVCIEIGNSIFVTCRPNKLEQD